MELSNVTFQGPPVDDSDLLDRLPEPLSGLLRQINGFIQFHGGLHVRGACREPAWHSLRAAWLSDTAFHRLYPEVQPEDIPFAEDCMGDQFLLRGEEVYRLAAETGECEPLGLSVGQFLQSAQTDPIEFLTLQPLLQFQEEGGHLEPGQLLACHPPFCTTQAANGVHFASVPSDERHAFLANLAAHLRDVPDGGTISFEIIE